MGCQIRLELSENRFSSGRQRNPILNLCQASGTTESDKRNLNKTEIMPVG